MPRKKKQEMKVTKETGVKVLTENFVDAEPTELDQAIAKAAAENTDTDGENEQTVQHSPNGAETDCKENAEFADDSDSDTDADPPPIQEQEWTYETCKVDFTEQELAEMSGDMARKIGDFRDKEDQQKAVAAQMKAEIKTLSGEVEQLAVKVRNKFEYKQVKCEVIRDYPHKEITYIRLDTGEIHRRRTMRADEAQTELPV